jgi:hypothetical protein
MAAQIRTWAVSLPSFALRPKRLLKLTRYCRHCSPGQSRLFYRLSPGLQYVPMQAG